VNGQKVAADAECVRRERGQAGRSGGAREAGRWWAVLAAEGRLLGGWVRGRTFLLLVALLLGAYFLALQGPVWMDLDVGAVAGDQPAQPNSFVHLVGGAFTEPVGRAYDQVYWDGTYAAEQGGGFTFRWTEDLATLTFCGLPHAPAVVRLRMHGAVAGPETTAQLRAAGRPLAAFAVPYPLHHYAFVVDPGLLDGDTLRLEAESTTFVPGGEDSRSLGLAVDRVGLSVVGAVRPTAGPWTALYLTGTAALLYLALRRAGVGAPPACEAAGAGSSAPASRRGRAVVRALAHGDAWALASGVAAVLWGGIVLVALLLPSRLLVAAYAPGLFLAAALAYPLLLLTLAAAGALYGRGGIVPGQRTWRWLAVLFLVAFLARFGGALSPRYASHDGPFHANRLGFAERGVLFFEHQSIEAGMRSDPYPGALYLALLPLTVAVDAPDALLAFFLGWLAAGEVLLFWFLARQVLDVRASCWAALLYAAFPIALSAFWFGIYANLFANGVVLLVAAALVLAWQGRLSASPLPWIPLFALLFLAHFGTVILWGPVLLVWGGLLYRRGGFVQRQRLRWLCLSGVAGLILVTVLYYSYFSDFFAGMGAALGMALDDGSGDAGLSWSRTLAEARVWWRWGFVADYAGLGVPLGLLGRGLLPRPQRRSAVALWSWAMWGVAAFFWVVSMATAYFTRYMLFLLPVTAMGTAQVLSLLWKRGRAGRVTAVVVLSYVCALTAVLWLGLCLLGWHPPHVL